VSDPAPRRRICPSCRRETSSLKYELFLESWLFLLVAAAYEVRPFVACPSCLRRSVWKKAVALLPAAHLSWPLVVFPWAAFLTVCTFIPGHSSQFAISERNPAYLDPPAWRRWVAALGRTFFAYLPVLGVVYCAVALYLTRNDDAHYRSSARTGLIISALLTALLAGAILYDGCVNGWGNAKW